MSKETVWVCDKCGISGSKLEVPGVVEVRDDRALEESNVYLDLCVDCITELLSLIESFMNPKREYPTEKEVKITVDFEKD